MNLPANFDKTKFTQEEMETIKLCVKNGQIETIPTLIGHNLTPLKEHELEKMKNQLMPLKVGYENKVRTVLHELSQLSGDVFIKDPKQEAVIQKFLDKELQLIEQKNKLTAEINELSYEVKDTSKDEAIAVLKQELKLVDKTYKQEFNYDKLKENIIEACQIVLEDVVEDEEEEVVEHIVSEEDVKANPGEDLKEGEVVELPKNAMRP